MPVAKAGAKFRTRIIGIPGFENTHCVEVPAAVIKKLLGPVKGSPKGRFLCDINGKVKFPCGLMPLGQGRAYIFLSKVRMKAIGGHERGDSITVTLTPDKSRYGMPMPAELKEVLKQDPEAKKRFDGLKPGKQRNIIHYVSTAKSEKSRVERSLWLLGNLKKLPPGKEAMGDLFNRNLEVPGVVSEKVPAVKKRGEVSFEELTGRKR